jgi:hypothetical protein
VGSDALLGVAGRPPTEAWARGCGSVLGIGLIVGALWPLLLRERTGAGYAFPLRWPWDYVPSAYALPFLWIPLGLGAAALGASLALRCAARAIVLFATSVGALSTSLVVSSGPEAIDGLLREGSRATATFLLVLVLFVAPILIAVGNHVRRGFPASASARGLAGVSGSLVLLAFLVPVVDGRPGIAYLFRHDTWRGAWPWAALALVALAYGGLGVASLPAGSVRLRCVLTGVVGRLLLLGLPLAILLDRSIRVADQDALAAVAMGVVKGSLLLFGHLLLVAVGLAAWIDAALASRAPRPIDASRLDRVFR